MRAGLLAFRNPNPTFGRSHCPCRHNAILPFSPELYILISLRLRAEQSSRRRASSGRRASRSVRAEKRAQQLAPTPQCRNTNASARVRPRNPTSHTNHPPAQLAARAATSTSHTSSIAHNPHEELFVAPASGALVVLIPIPAVPLVYPVQLQHEVSNFPVLCVASPRDTTTPKVRVRVRVGIACFDCFLSLMFWMF